MSGVADQVLKQFVANFSERLKERAPAAPSTPAPGSGTDTTAAASAPMRSAEAAQPAAARELNAFAVAWGMVRDWLHHLFARRA
jgi:Rod binding domain-containing protein